MISPGARTAPKNQIEPRLDYYLDARQLISKHVNSISLTQFYYTFISVLAFVILFLFNDFNIYGALAKNFLLSGIIFYCFIHIIFVKMIEKKQLKSTLDALDVIIYGYFLNLKNRKESFS